MSDALLLERIQSNLVALQLFRHDCCLVVAVSGGPDSLCLLHLLWRLRTVSAGPALHVAHLDHGFRGAQSAAEADFVAQTAADWGLPATIERIDVPALIARTGQNRQAAARAVRYAFLGRVARNREAAAVVVAHQADDQAETVLLHLLRGAGPAGLRGMRPLVPWAEWALDQSDTSAGPPLVRPLLETTRAEIEAYCASEQLAPQHDPSNTNPDYTRSRVRTELLPLLSDYNPQLLAALSRTARVCADDYDFLQTQLDQHWSTLATVQPGRVIFQQRTWQPLHPALQRYGLRRAARLLLTNNSAAPGYDQIEAARVATAQPPGYQQTLGQGLTLRVEHESFLILHEQADVDALERLENEDADVPQIPPEPIPLVVPGITPLGSGWQVTVATPDQDAPATSNNTRWQIDLDAATLDGPLFMRCRQPGDRFRPAGGVGSRKLQDFFIDNKVPRRLRTAWPMLTTPRSIIWIVGLRADARFLATAHTREPLRVELQRSDRTNHEEPYAR